MTSPLPIAWPVYAAAIGLVAFATGGLGRIALVSSGCLGKSQLRQLAAEVAIGILGFCVVLGALSELNAPLQAVIVVVGVLLVAGLVSLVVEVIRAGRSTILRIGVAVVLSVSLLIAGFTPVNPGAADPVNYAYITATLFRPDWVPANLGALPDSSWYVDLAREGMLVRSAAVALLWPPAVWGLGLEARSVAGLAAWLTAISFLLLVDLLHGQAPLLVRAVLAAGGLGAFNSTAGPGRGSGQPGLRHRVRTGRRLAVPMAPHCIIAYCGTVSDGRRDHGCVPRIPCSCAAVLPVYSRAWNANLAANRRRGSGPCGRSRADPGSVTFWCGRICAQQGGARPPLVAAARRSAKCSGCLARGDPPVPATPADAASDHSSSLVRLAGVFLDDFVGSPQVCATVRDGGARGAGGSLVMAHTPGAERKLCHIQDRRLDWAWSGDPGLAVCQTSQSFCWQAAGSRGAGTRDVAKSRDGRECRLRSTRLRSQPGLRAELSTSAGLRRSMQCRTDQHATGGGRCGHRQFSRPGSKL